ncbi:hypothetical protein MG293_004490 [Ovis ammon polii]|uniref:Uncharacterized protein n=1 Tax=Ovis ammon polii TaxID=230172 RepID=A0AAD4YDQ2_OVIAM|nr:hypothetical protein MG293_004490 [Ovis ammon polii]
MAYVYRQTHVWFAHTLLGLAGFLAHGRKTRGSNLLINSKKHLSHYEKSFLTPGAAEMLGKAQRMNGTQIQALKRRRNRDAFKKLDATAPIYQCYDDVFFMKSGCGTELLGTLNQKAAVKNRAVRAAKALTRAISVKAVNTELML